jgi:hypothetical protein
MPQSKDTLLRALKRGVRNQADVAPVRVVGIDNWSWWKGTTYGTIMVGTWRAAKFSISCRIGPPNRLLTGSGVIRRLR